MAMPPGARAAIESVMDAIVEINKNDLELLVALEDIVKNEEQELEKQDRLGSSSKSRVSWCPYQKRL